MFLPLRNLKFYGFLLVFLNAHCNQVRNACYSVSDLPVFLWPREKHNGWVSLGINYGRAETGFDRYGSNGPLFCGFGNTRFADLAKNYKILENAPKTQNFIKTVCLNNAYKYEERNGLFCAGNAELFELNLLLSMPFNENFMAFLELPMRFTKLSKLMFVDANGRETEFAKLVNKSIDEVLEENNYEKMSDTQYLNGPADATASLGWIDKFNFNDKSSPVTGLGISLRAGIIIPTSISNGFEKNYLYNIPLGNNGSFGFKLQADAQLEFEPYLCVVGSLESKVFLHREDLIELKTAKSIQGINFGPKGYVEYDNGHSWKAGLVAKFGSRDIGAFATIGYSYLSKETSYMELKPRETESERSFQIVKDIKESTSGSIATDDYTDVQLTNELINSNSQWERQYTHVIHLGVQVNPKTLYSIATDNGESMEEPALENLNPLIELAYSYPFYGKSYIAMPIVSGNFGFGIRLKF